MHAFVLAGTAAIIRFTFTQVRVFHADQLSNPDGSRCDREMRTLWSRRADGAVACGACFQADFE